jgi:hypothetical protein
MKEDYATGPSQEKLLQQLREYLNGTLCNITQKTIQEGY